MQERSYDLSCKIIISRRAKIMANYGAYNAEGFYDAAAQQNPYYYGVSLNPQESLKSDTTLSPEDYKILTETGGGNSLVLTDEEAAIARCNHRDLKNELRLKEGAEPGTLRCEICGQTWNACLNLTSADVAVWVKTGESILQLIKTFGNLPKEYAQIIYGSLGFVKKVPEMWNKAQNNIKTLGSKYENWVSTPNVQPVYAQPNYGYTAPVPPMYQQPQPYAGYYQNPYMAQAVYAQPAVAAPQVAVPQFVNPVVQQPMPSGGIMTSEFVQGGVVPPQQTAATPSAVIPTPGPVANPVPTAATPESPMFSIGGGSGVAPAIPAPQSTDKIQL